MNKQMGRPKKVPEDIVPSALDLLNKSIKEQSPVSATVTATAEKPKEETPVEFKEGGGRVEKGEYSARITTDYYGMVDPFYLSWKDPEFAYRWLRDDPANLAEKTGDILAQKGGWQICGRDHIERASRVADVNMKDKLSKDGHLRTGSHILAFMPKELYEKKMAYKKEQAGRKPKAVQRMLKHGDQALAGVGHRDMKGIQTKEQFGNVNWR